MAKKSIIIITLFIVSALLAVIITFPTNQAFLIACNVGQGDALLFTKGATQILIDGGPDNKVLECLKQNMPFWDRKIELVINTHPEKDHLAGLLPVVEQYQVGQLVSNSFWMDTSLFRDFIAAVREKRIPVYSPKKGDRLEVAGFTFQVLWPEWVIGDVGIWKQDGELAKGKNTVILGEKTIEPNEWSIVALANYDDKKILLAGDISGETEKKIMDKMALPKIDILKVAHHGSKYSTSEEWLSCLKPKLAVISAGKNPWGHPTQEALKRLRDLGIKILRTDKEEIRILLD